MPSLCGWLTVQGSDEVWPYKPQGVAMGSWMKGQELVQTGGLCWLPGREGRGWTRG